MTLNEQQLQERNTNLLKLQPTIKKAAKSVAYIWNNILDAEDAEQLINIRLLESPGTIKKIAAMERDAQYRAIVGMGHQLASIERADYDEFRGAYRYSLQEVKNALNSGILVEEFDHFHEVVFDLTESLKILKQKSPQYAEAIADRYVEFNQPLDPAGKMRLSRSLSALTDEMNKANKRRFANRIDGPGTRKPVRAEAAHYQSKRQWDDESAEAVSRLLAQAQVSGR